MPDWTVPPDTKMELRGSPIRVLFGSELPLSSAISAPLRIVVLPECTQADLANMRVPLPATTTLPVPLIAPPHKAPVPCGPPDVVTRLGSPPGSPAGDG